MSKEMSVCEVLLNVAARVWEYDNHKLNSTPWYRLFRRWRLRQVLKNSERMYHWTMDMYYESVAKHYNITEK